MIIFLLVQSIKFMYMILKKNITKEFPGFRFSDFFGVTMYDGFVLTELQRLK